MELKLANGELMHVAMPASAYDPVERHERYMRTRQLKGRKKAAGPTPSSAPRGSRSATHAHQKQVLQERITGLQDKLTKLDRKIASLEHPSTADKNKAARESKKYRQAHKSELAAKAKRARDKAGSSSKSSSKTSAGGSRLAELKQLRSKVAGQIEVAKQKLSAL